MPTKKSKTQRLQELLRNPPTPPKLSEFMAAFVAAGGGMQELAMRLQQELENAPVGSPLAKSWASLIVSGLKSMNEQQSTSMGALTDDDLDREIKRQISELELMREGLDEPERS